MFIHFPSFSKIWGFLEIRVPSTYHFPFTRHSSRVGKCHFLMICFTSPKQVLEIISPFELGDVKHWDIYQPLLMMNTSKDVFLNHNKPHVFSCDRSNVWKYHVCFRDFRFMFLQTFLPNVPRLKPGACALLPAAWPVPASTPAATPAASRQAVLLVLRRRGDHGTLALVNLAGEAGGCGGCGGCGFLCKPLRQGLVGKHMGDMDFYGWCIFAEVEGIDSGEN